MQTKKKQNPYAFFRFHAILWQIARRRLIVSTRRANAPGQKNGEQIPALINPASKLVKWLVPIERDHIRAAVLSPVAGTLIHIIVHLVHTDRRAVRVLLAAVLGVQIHHFGLVAAHTKLRLEELGPTRDVPAAVAGQRRVPAAYPRPHLAGRLARLPEAKNARERTLGGRRRIQHVRAVLPLGLAAERRPRAHLVERVPFFRVVVDPRHERLALSVLQNVLVPRLKVQADEVVEALAFGDGPNQVLIAARLLAHVVGLAQPSAVVDARRLIDVRVVDDNFGVYVCRVHPFAAEVLRKKASGLDVARHLRRNDHLLGAVRRTVQGLAGRVQRLGRVAHREPLVDGLEWRAGLRARDQLGGRIVAHALSRFPELVAELVRAVDGAAALLGLVGLVEQCYERRGLGYFVTQLGEAFARVVVAAAASHLEHAASPDVDFDALAAIDDCAGGRPVVHFVVPL
ncbi:hypothetical protein BpHYR1_047029 [Brachionus plicatilis]|uniref:Uncharacterized protein n=1 Tax=Brachionus plicatilis TaxID=10195 RepID=A0A3M7SQL8_BRAPC|nr:hypothetical protein BpHYR1_047029 [Brachionus plicatilis]